MFLGFLKHGNSNRSHSTTLVLSVSIISTIVVMFLMFDSFFLQLPQTRSFISPLQNQDVQNCVMSYSYPTFYEVKSPESQFSKKYKLYLYREGNIDSPDHVYTLKKNKNVVIFLNILYSFMDRLYCLFRVKLEATNK